MSLREWETDGPRRAASAPLDARVRLQAVAWRSTLPVAAALVLGIGFLYTIRLAARPLAYLVLAIAIAEALAPIVARLERWLPRLLAISLVYFALIGVIVLVAMLAVPPLVAQMQDLVARAPELIDRARELVQRGQAAAGGQIADVVPDALGSLLRLLGAFLVTLPVRLVSGFVDVTLVGFLSVYWLIGAPDLQRFALSLLPDDRRDRGARVLHDMGQAMGGYVRGAAINAVIMGALAWVGLSLIGVRYALVLGALTMLGELVPVVGPVIVAVPVVLTALLQSPAKALLALALFTALQQVEGHLLTPNIMRRQTDMPQTLVIFAIVAGGAVGGVLGVLVSIPLAAALRVFVLQVLVPMVRSSTGASADGPREPAGVPGD